MLYLILGPSGSGKTSRVIGEIGERAARGEKSALIVPEQFSHDAERQLAGMCGASVCMHAEVLSFSRLCTRVLSECGGSAIKPLDGGGRILVMSRALNEAAPGLRVFRAAGHRADFLEELLSVYTELKTAAVTPDMLNAAAESGNEGPFADKLRDLALITASYEAFIPEGMCDPTDRLEFLAEKVADSSFGVGQKIYIDGFTDFTAQELEVIERLLKKGADVTVCLGCTGLEGDEPEFAIARRTANKLVGTAAKLRIGCEVLNVAPGRRSKAPELAFLDENLFSWDTCAFEGECNAVELYSARDAAAECELAAAAALRFARNGCRWREIAVVARNWESYSETVQGIFEKYGIPAYVSDKADILQKPVMALPLAALDVICSGWERKSVMRCLKTELFGDERPARDALENYVLKWGIRGSASWRGGDWQMNPSGYSDGMTDDEEEELRLVNSARKAAAEPLGAFEDAMKTALTAREKCAALYGFLHGLGLEERLAAKASKLREDGMLRLAEEYESLWDILVGALEQYAHVLGDAIQDTEEFSALLKLLLSQYEIGTIPVAIDRVGMGDMSRLRRRDLKCLIVIGASDDVIPSRGKSGGVLPESDRAELKRRGIELGGTVDETFEREMSVLYASMTLPSEKLVLSYPVCGGAQPSFLITRAAKLFNIQLKEGGHEVKIAAEKPCFELAVTAHCIPDDVYASSAREYFKALPESSAKLDGIAAASSVPRGRLERETAERLYGHSIGISASRAERFKSCKFSYFVQYALRAKPRKKAGMDAPETGTFMHYVLENVARDVKAAGGFEKTQDEKLRELTAKYTGLYAETVLGGLDRQSGRFKYLFGRLKRDAETIVLDMAGELRASEFEPYEFELDFSNGGDMPPAVVTDGDVTVQVGGKVDRVDGWIKDDKLYLKVVDYKTGRKAFSLSDVWYGMGMQMLLYLFVLQKHGGERYGREIVPAGVLYTPARDLLLSMPRGASDSEIERERAKKLVRSGLLLDDPEVLAAMESGETPKYIPVKISKSGERVGDSLASAEKLGRLAAHIDRTLIEMGREMRSGAIEADPYYRSAQDNACLYCEYYEACRFDESGGDRPRRLSKLKTYEAWEKIEGRSENAGKDNAD